MKLINVNMTGIDGAAVDNAAEAILASLACYLNGKEPIRKNA